MPSRSRWCVCQLARRVQRPGGGGMSIAIQAASEAPQARVGNQQAEVQTSWVM